MRQRSLAYARDDSVCLVGALRKFQQNCHPERKRGTFCLLQNINRLRVIVLPSALSDIAKGNVLPLLGLSFAQPRYQPET